MDDRTLKYNEILLNEALSLFLKCLLLYEMVIVKYPYHPILTVFTNPSSGMYTLIIIISALTLMLCVKQFLLLCLGHRVVQFCWIGFFSYCDLRM